MAALGQCTFLIDFLGFVFLFLCLFLLLLFLFLFFNKKVIFSIFVFFLFFQFFFFFFFLFFFLFYYFFYFVFYFLLLKCFFLVVMGHHRVEANVLRINPLSANLTKWSNTLKQFVFYHFLVLGINGSILSIYHLFAH